MDKPVDIVAFEFDWWFELASADGTLTDGEEPLPVGQDGVLYYVRFVHAGETSTATWVDSGGFSDIDAAIEQAGLKVPSPIEWIAD